MPFRITPELIFLVLLVIIVVVGAAVWTRLSRRGPKADSPLDIAERRYAQDKLTHEEFERIKEDLNH